MLQPDINNFCNHLFAFVLILIIAEVTALATMNWHIKPFIESKMQNPLTLPVQKQTLKSLIMKILIKGALL